MKQFFYALLVLNFMSFSFSQDCIEGVEVELWPDYFYGGCFDIATTTSIDFSSYYAQIDDVIPAEIGQLVNLQILDLSGANGMGLGMTGTIPSELGQLTNLEYLDLTNNLLEGDIPSELGQLININDLRLSNNQLTGSIPVEMGNLNNMYRLFLDNNQLTGSIPLELGSLPALQWLHLDNNQLTGSIPDFDNNILKHLYFQNNQLTGVLPAIESNVIRKIDFSENELSGPLVSDWNYASMDELYLQNNQISGEIPLSILDFQIGNFSSLDLSSNQLTGSIPEDLFRSIWYFDFSDNQLSGELTEEMFSNLDPPPYNDMYSPSRGWNLSSNQLTGVLPSNLCNGSLSYFITLIDNQFCEPYPSCIDNIGSQDTSNCSASNCADGEVELWGVCYNIEETLYLNLASSNLSGEIPSEIGNLINLAQLFLQDNQLTGEIPPSIGNLTNLIFLNLDENQLTGEIPSSIGDLTNLSELILDNNQLTGEIPPSIGNLTNLTYLQLMNNQLTGEIPSSIGDMTNLYYFYVNNNQLSGYVPEEICNISTVSLSQNQFCPPYPQCIVEEFTDLNLNGQYDVGESYIDYDGDNEYDNNIGAQDTSACEELSNIEIYPFEYSLGKPYPNPFNPITSVSFSIPYYDKVQISVYSLNGKLITELTDNFYQPGEYTIIWDGNGFASGTYLIRMVSTNYESSETVTLIK